MSVTGLGGRGRDGEDSCCLAGWTLLLTPEPQVPGMEKVPWDHSFSGSVFIWGIFEPILFSDES